MERFERPRLPVIITGLTQDWPAAQAWAPEQLAARFGEHKFKVELEGFRVELEPSA